MSVTKQDVLYALLALDAYNRHGESAKLKISENEIQISKHIGNAVWKRSSDRMETGGENSPADPELSGSKLAGFSASYYDFGGKTVIAYRGTDFDLSSVDGWIEFLRDFGSGWLQSFGLVSPEDFTPVPGSTLVNFQPYYAIKFFEQVTQSKTLLSDQEKAELRAAGQHVGALENQLEEGLQAKAEAESELPAARDGLDNIRPVYEAAQQAAAA